MGEACSMHQGNMCKKFLVAISEGTRLLKRLRCRWQNNIRMDIEETEWGRHVAQDRPGCRIL